MLPYVICYIVFSFIFGIFSFCIELARWKDDYDINEDRPGITRFVLGVLLWPLSIIFDIIFGVHGGKTKF